MTWLEAARTEALGSEAARTEAPRSEAPRTGFLAKGPIFNLISALSAELWISKFFSLIRKQCRSKSADEAS